MKLYSSLWIVAVTAGVLAYGPTASADPELQRIRSTFTVDDANPPREGVTRVPEPASLRAVGQIADNCPAFPLGSLTLFGSFAGSVNQLTNNFGADASCPAPCGFYGGGAFDGIVEFTVPTSGNWTFGTCNTDTNYDSSLQLRSGAPCPGTTCVAQDDDSCNACNAPFKARIAASLTAGTQYYLIVDGYGGMGGTFRVDYSGPCNKNSDCNDGLFCNGTETCVGHFCQGGIAPCTGTTPFCDEGADRCTGCTSNAQCPDDGAFCNGPELCNMSTGLCGHVGNPCDRVQTCNETTNVCVDPDPCLAYSQPNNPQTVFFPQDPVWNPCWTPSFAIGDDIELSDHAGRNLISYDVLVRSRTLPGFPPDGPWTLITELWSVDPAPGDNLGLPLAPIPGTRCEFPNLPFGAGTFPVSNCRPNNGMPTGVILPNDPSGNGVDFYLVFFTSRRNAGFQIADAPRKIGGPGLDDFFQSSPGPLFVLQDTTTPCAGTWRYGQLIPPALSDMIANVCTEPVGPCCLPEGGCDQISETECSADGGRFLGTNEILHPRTCAGPNDGDGDGTRDECDLCPDDPHKAGPGQCDCGFPDADTDADGTANCRDLCPLDPGKTRPGVCGCGTSDADSDHDGTPDCSDNCPKDPGKTEPGVCGCGVADVGDTDHDGTLNCIDVCPGLDDSLFAPGCVGAIPTVSQWGMVIMALLLLVAAKLRFGRQARPEFYSS